MDIGFPIDVHHITHVTFDRLHGFLGLPMEFELEVSKSVPSASVTVFGVSVESMQCSQDAHGNSVPLILLLLQEKLYEQDGLKTEGIFRVNPDNFEEEQLRGHISKGIIPDNMDTHCLAGLIKAWFRELPKGVLDSLSYEEIMPCQTEDECTALIKKLPPIESALFDWAINLMADVVQEEAFNKMNARNVAVVFAPNMTQMLDPMTALKHAVQVMNLLKILILKTLRDRQRPVNFRSSFACVEPLGESKEKQWDTTRQVHDVVHDTLKKETCMDNASSEVITVESAEKCHNLIVGKSPPPAGAPTKSTEIIEEIRSADASRHSYTLAFTQRDSGDKFDGAFDGQSRFSDQIIWDNFLGDGHECSGINENCRQSRPLAYWLRMGRLPGAKNHFKV